MPLTSLLSDLLLWRVLTCLPLGSTSVLMQVAHFKDASLVQFYDYMVGLTAGCMRRFAPILDVGLNCPVLSFRHRPVVFYDPWPDLSNMVWYDADGCIQPVRASDLADERLWAAVARVLRLPQQRPGAFERFLREDRCLLLGARMLLSF